MISVDFLKFFNRNKYLFFFHFLACLIYMLHKHIGKKPGPHNKEAQQKIFLSIVEPLFILYDKI